MMQEELHTIFFFLGILLAVHGLQTIGTLDNVASYLKSTFNGDILTPAPSWVSYEPQAEIGRNKVHWLETSRANNWFPTAKELENKLKKISKNKNIIFILNSPNNPSGAICQNLKELAKVAKKYKLIVLSDENLYRFIF